MSKIGVITEQGDLGLGYDVLNEKDQSAYNQQKDKENKEKNGKDNK